MIAAVVLAALIATAVSLKKPMDEAIAAFQSKVPGEKLELEAAASGVIVSHVEHGAPVDLFLSASPVEMDRVARTGRLVPGTRHALATNRLVVVVRKGLAVPEAFDGLMDPRFKRIAIGNPKTVPAGRYAEQAIKQAELSGVIDRRLVFGEHVRQVLDYVVRGEADAGLVYASDVKLAGTGVLVGPVIDAKLHDPVVYEAAIVKGEGTARAKAFLEFLSSPVGLEILEKNGFGPPPQ
ncbi:MAG TPA: molybdate ABC transporter substrate-binding protein [Candidatus Polarisedimenticolaceae bacterium]|nr:molybdate ABC transporter substrate-binding protein [Candidatus Polarisedimenticolaceae bacterium]